MRCQLMRGNATTMECLQWRTAKFATFQYRCRERAYFTLLTIALVSICGPSSCATFELSDGMLTKGPSTYQCFLKFFALRTLRLATKAPPCFLASFFASLEPSS